MNIPEVPFLLDHLPILRPALPFSYCTLPFPENRNLSYPSLSLRAMVMSQHHVPNILNTASTQDWLSPSHSHDYELTPERIFSPRRASIQIFCHQTSSWSMLECEVNLSHSSGCESTNQYMESEYLSHLPIDWVQINQVHVLYRFSSIVASRSISEFALWWPSISCNHCLQTHLQTRLITASMLMPSGPPGASWTSLGHSCLRCKIMASQCISKLAQWWPPSSHHHGLQVYPHPCLIMAPKCHSEFNWSLSSRVPRITPNHYLQVVQIYPV